MNAGRNIHSLRSQLIGALVIIIVLSSTLAYAANILLARHAFNEMVEQNDLDVARALAASLGTFYEENGSWTRISTEIARLRAAIAPPQSSAYPHGHDGRSGPGGPGNDFPVVVTDAEGRPIYSGIMSPDHESAAPAPARYDTHLGQRIVAGGTTVGFVYFKSMVLRVYNPREQQFATSITRTTGLSLALQLIIAFVLGLLMAGRIGRPISRLEAAVKRISEGKALEHVGISGGSEIASLSSHFNLMIDRLRIQEASRRNLFADVAHELRTPVSILQANLEMMIDGVYPPDRDRLNSLLEETQLLSRLIADLRTISDLELGAASVRLEPVPIGRVVVESCNAFHSRFEQQGTVLALEGIDEGCLVNADTHRLAQVVRNILENVLKYAPESREVIVAMRRFRTENGEVVRVAVSDSGPGLPDSELERIFDRFYRSEQSRNRELGGRGLGLAISRQFLEACGGTIGAESRSPHGLTVWIQLPVTGG